MAVMMASPAMTAPIGHPRGGVVLDRWAGGSSPLGGGVVKAVSPAHYGANIARPYYADGYRDYYQDYRARSPAAAVQPLAPQRYSREPAVVAAMGSSPLRQWNDRPSSSSGSHHRVVGRYEGTAAAGGALIQRPLDVRRNIGSGDAEGRRPASTSFIYRAEDNGEQQTRVLDPCRVRSTMQAFQEARLAQVATAQPALPAVRLVGEPLRRRSASHDVIAQQPAQRMLSPDAVAFRQYGAAPERTADAVPAPPPRDAAAAAAEHIPVAARREEVMHLAEAPMSPLLAAKPEKDRLLEVLNDPSIVEKRGTPVYNTHVAKGLSFEEPEEVGRVLEAMDAAVGVNTMASVYKTAGLLLGRMRRIQRTDGRKLALPGFLDLYVWALYWRWQALEPIKFARSDLIGGEHKGAPQQFYSIGDTLGSGTFGVVNKVLDRRTGMKRVMKTVNKQRATQSGTPLSMLQREIDILALLDHPHILRIFEHYNDTVNLYIIMDVCEGGEMLNILEAHLTAGMVLQESWISTVFGQILSAISYCHSKGVIHKDLKFENVMFLKKTTAHTPLQELHIVVIDVGLAELFGPQHGAAWRSRVVSGTPSTMAPEVLRGDFSYRCDVWSIGCMLFAMYNTMPEYIPDGKGGQVPYAYPYKPGRPTQTDCNGLQALMQAQSQGPPMWQIASTASPEAQEAVLNMLSYDDFRRPDADRCLALAYFQHRPQGGDRGLQLTREQVSLLVREPAENRWWRAMTLKAATNMPASKLAQLKERYASLDTNKDGVIETSEMVQALQQLGVKPAIAQKAAQAMDFDSSGTIDWSEFTCAMLPMAHEIFAASLQIAFQSLDLDNSGAFWAFHCFPEPGP
eukprot:TRINITY_DN12540_c0_g1_i2.p1 TRINITY_DN12540_c0_g1~~TRINITY_DN12540_c0_g1_i2.p1  ORF type:complete len:851 (-),score=190.46 TRINITY_DN12540_c0_g1_i2:269-2821(-)